MSNTVMYMYVFLTTISKDPYLPAIPPSPFVHLFSLSHTHSLTMLLMINTFCTDSNGKTTSYSLIHYGFQREEHEIQHPPHRNASKGSTPYKRTKPSTMQRIKEIAKDHKA